MEAKKCLQALELLSVYIKMKINYNVSFSFDYFLNNVRIYDDKYTFEKRVNVNTWNNRFGEFYIAQTTKAF